MHMRFPLRNASAQLLPWLLPLLTACQRPADIVASLNGQQFIRPQTQVAQGQLTPRWQGADYRRFRAMGLRLG